MRAAPVVYATRNGSTREVAEAVANRMRTGGVSVECREAHAARAAVHDVDLVVVGGALYSGRWHRDARRYLKRHRYELPAVAVFGGVDPPGTHTGRDLRDWAVIDRWSAELVAGDDRAG